MADIEKNESAALIASNKVEGTTVYNEAGEKLGSIYNFMVNKRTGRVEYAVLQFGGFLGMGSEYYPMPWDTLEYDEDQGGFVIDVDKDTLQKAPHFSADEEPDYDSTYGAQIYGAYGLNYPGHTVM